MDVLTLEVLGHLSLNCCRVVKLDNANRYGFQAGKFSRPEAPCSGYDFELLVSYWPDYKRNQYSLGGKARGEFFERFLIESLPRISCRFVKLLQRNVAVFTGDFE